MAALWVGVFCAQSTVKQGTFVLYYILYDSDEMNR